MPWRAIILLAMTAGASIALTWVFGPMVLIALGLILTQLKVIGQKLVGIELPHILAWLKLQASVFLRIELIKKWLLGSLAPLLMGPMLRKRIEAVLTRYKDAVRRRYQAMLGWYQRLNRVERTVAALIVLFATLGLSVTSLGVWLILFSVKLPFWLIAAGAALGRMVWSGLSKALFRTIAFLQLGWAWRLIRRRLPADYMDRKRRWDFRVARAVVRSRRLTLKQLHDQKDGLSMRLSLLAAYFRAPRPMIDPPDDPPPAQAPAKTPARTGAARAADGDAP